MIFIERYRDFGVATGPFAAEDSASQPHDSLTSANKVYTNQPPLIGTFQINQNRHAARAEIQAGAFDQVRVGLNS